MVILARVCVLNTMLTKMSSLVHLYPPVVAESPASPSNAKEALSALGRGAYLYFGALGQHLESRAGWLKEEDSASRASATSGNLPNLVKC